MRHLRLLQRTEGPSGPASVTAGEQARTLAAWAALSAEAGWRDPGDWDTAQVRQTLDRCAASGATLEDAARDLGAARFYQGVGIVEVMADWNCFLQATGRPLELKSLQAAVQGWVEASEQSHPFGCTDPATGLNTAAHIEELLHAIYAFPSTPEWYSTAVLGFPAGISASWTESGWPTAARLGDELNGLVSAASAAACFVAPRLLVLFRSGPDTTLLIRHFHGRCLKMLGGAPVNLIIEPLPLQRVRLTGILSP